jgi:hypothetical protein
MTKRLGALMVIELCLGSGSAHAEGPHSGHFSTPMKPEIWKAGKESIDTLRSCTAAWRGPTLS